MTDLSEEATHYIKYEIFIPTEYIDKRNKKQSINHRELKNFFTRIRKKYKGYTEANPVAPPLYKGFYEEAKEIYIDHLTVFIVLVEQSKQDKALQDFKNLKKKLERKYNQQFVLILYQPIQVIGRL
ncbi:MAG: hypothetical protein HYR55_03760 [Acidobacteria bacterium]|nr:hypothetical protein [Acidobacteriota bacterium]MBI3656850.1 hypothetical protein [Acidobacteriota bacterium]